MTCAFTDCGVPSCPVCKWSRPNAPDPDQQHWDWLAAEGFSPTEIMEIRAGTLAQRAKRAEQAKKREQTALERDGLRSDARKLAGGTPRPSRDPATTKRKRKAL